MFVFSCQPEALCLIYAAGYATKEDLPAKVSERARNKEKTTDFASFRALSRAE
jgi:hypothetical protein